MQYNTNTQQTPEAQSQPQEQPQSEQLLSAQQNTQRNTSLYLTGAISALGKISKALFKAVADVVGMIVK